MENNIIIINCDWDNNEETNGSNLIERKIERGECKIFNIFENKISIDRLKKYNRIIITGSNSSVDENKKWIKNLLNLIEKISNLRIPTLGICFGYQAIGVSNGGELARGKKTEYGFREVKLTEEGNKNIIFNNVPKNFRTYEYHKDFLSKLPEDAINLAENNFSNQAFKLENFIGVQFHPEIDIETAKKMAIRDGKKVDEVVRDTTKNQSTRVINNFLEVDTKKIGE